MPVADDIKFADVYSAYNLTSNSFCICTFMVVPCFPILLTPFRHFRKSNQYKLVGPINADDNSNPVISTPIADSGLPDDSSCAFCRVSPNGFNIVWQVSHSPHAGPNTKKYVQ